MANRAHERDPGDEDEPGDGSEGRSFDLVASVTGWLERARGSSRPAGIEPRRSGAPKNPGVPTKWSIDRLDEREKRFSFVAAAVAVIFGTLIYLFETNNHNFHLAKGQMTPQTTLVVGLVCGGVLLAATLVGRRAPVGFVSLFTFLALGTSDLLLGVPFLALAVWLLYRSYKIQRDATADARAARSAAPASRSSRSRPTPARPAASSAPKKRRSKVSPGPEANKRYTPKRPPPPAPKPSRRERKAAQTND